MKLFSFLYKKMMVWAQHRHAPYYLFTLSFAESSFFPLPPDLMLAPMALAKPHRAWFYASMTTIASVLGGIFGYLLGFFCFKLIHPLIVQVGYGPLYEQVMQWFNVWGFWIIFLAGFSPIPYKLFTFAAGALHMALLPFILSSAIGRGGRFFLVSAIIRWGGPKMEDAFYRYIDWIGWISVAVLGVSYLIYRLI